jgi:hypothetical protein
VVRSARTSRTEQLDRAQSKFDEARSAWTEALAGDSRGAARGDGEGLVTAAAQARSEGDPLRVERSADQLLALSRVCRLDAAWLDSQDDALALEGPVDGQGVPTRTAAPETLRLLGEYREAIAAGDVSRVRDLAPQLRRARESEDRTGTGRTTRLPVPTGAVRRLNGRWNTAGLELFDRLTADHREALAQQRAGQAAQIADEAERAFRRLIQPAPAWKRAAPAVASIVILVAVGWTAWSWMQGNELTDVAVLAVGDLRPEILFEGGTPVNADGVKQDGIWVFKLAPGRYVARAEGRGSQVEFSVPDKTRVVLAGIDATGTLKKRLLPSGGEAR